MSTLHQNLSTLEKYPLKDAQDYTVGIVVAEWNNNITNALLEGAQKTLLNSGVLESNIKVSYVPGAFELVFGANYLQYDYNVIIVLGCVIRGGTPHFDYICNGVTQGISNLNSNGETPIIYGLLTTDNMEQAIERAGGIHGNKGTEAAITALKMIEFTFLNDIKE